MVASALLNNNLQKLSVVIPARNEEHCIAATIEHLYQELLTHSIPHEIIVIDDGSSDNTWNLLNKIQVTTPTLRPLQNEGAHGFGYAVLYGLDHMKGDTAVIVMADESDDCTDVTRYWEKLNEGYDCVFGSRFMNGSIVVDYPWFKYILNRLANSLIRFLFKLPFNDTTNAFKCYRKKVLDGCRPFVTRHFNLTVELPLKAIIHGYRWAVIPIHWKNRRKGLAKFKIKEVYSRYFLIIFYLWIESILLKGREDDQ
jgi:dolichol-phosphate mannosyltransferase